MYQKTAAGSALARPAEGGVSHWSPWSELSELRHQMDDLFTRAFGYTPLSRMIPSEPAGFAPDVDIWESNGSVVLTAALPGFTRDQINVETTSDAITIHGERKPLFDNEKAKHFRRSWVSDYCQFNATYSLPTEIAPNKVKASFRDGILRLEMPKTEEAKTKAVKVNITSGS